ncbi:MAG: DUF6134 family protein, partial [Pseudomonadota bacterium]
YDIAALYDGGATYTIFRKGKPIGTHKVDIAVADKRLTVDVTSKIRVTVLKIPVFSFDYRATEQWQDNTLLSVESEVQENDKNTIVSMTTQGDQTTLSTGKEKLTTDRLDYTSNHWNPSVLGSRRVFNTLTGQASDVSIALIDEQSEVNGVAATRYRYSGDIEAEVWYDRQGRWVKLQFKGEDGSKIEYIINP